jgi:Isopropylmalate/homocitrate/citramalate synthases
MFHIIDSTLNYITEENTEFTKENALEFIQLLKMVGITDILISKQVYRLLEQELPMERKFYLELEATENTSGYYGINFFFKRYKTGEDRVICSYQLNDVREIMKLKTFHFTEGLLLTGLDDFICHDYRSKFQQIKECANAGRIILRPENNYNCASAIAVEYVMSGGQDIITSFLGIGNLAATEQVIMALRYTGQFRMRQNYGALIEMKELYERAGLGKIGNKAPIVGDSIFDIESGIHVDGVLKNSSNYECVSPQMLGRTRKIILGKHSGRVSIEYKRQELELPVLTQSQECTILYRIKEISMRNRRSISDEEFIKLVNNVIEYGS